MAVLTEEVGELARVMADVYKRQQGTGAYRTGKPYGRAPIRYGNKAGGSTKEIGHRAK